MPEPQGSPTRREAAQRLKRQQRNARWLKFIAAAVAFVSLAGSLIIFWPRIAVKATGSEFDPSNPHPPPFVISNIGVTQLRNVQPMIRLCLIPRRPVDTLVPNVPLCNGPPSAPYRYGPWFKKSLSMHEKYMIRLDAGPGANGSNGLFDFGSGTISRLEISIIVDYRPWLLPIPCEKVFKFSTRKEENGMLAWFQILNRKGTRP